MEEVIENTLWEWAIMTVEYEVSSQNPLSLPQAKLFGIALQLPSEADDPSPPQQVAREIRNYRGKRNNNNCNNSCEKPSQ